MPRPGPRRVDYPDQEKYPGAYVTLPAEWLGDHLERHATAVAAAARYRSTAVMNAAVSLVLADEWGGIPGVEGDDPKQWRLAETPAPLLTWLKATVFDEFARVFIVPKASPAPSPNGSTAKAEATTAGSSGPTA